MPISIEATHEIPIIGTKTVRDENAKIYWTPGDAISLFYDNGINGGSKFVAQNEEVALKTTFSGYISAVTGGSDMAEDDCFFWGLYPYDKLASCDGQTVTMRIPSVQPGKEDTFAPGMAPSLGRSQKLSLSFRNIWSGFGFTVVEPGFQSLTFRGNNDELIAGRAKIGIDENGLPTVVEILDGVREVTLTAPTAEGFVPGKYYYMQFFPVTLENGFTVELTSQAMTGTWVYGESMTYPRSTWKRAAKVDGRVTLWKDMNGMVLEGFSIDINWDETTYSDADIINDYYGDDFDWDVEGGSDAGIGKDGYKGDRNWDSGNHSDGDVDKGEYGDDSDWDSEAETEGQVNKSGYGDDADWK